MKLEIVIEQEVHWRETYFRPVKEPISKNEIADFITRCSCLDLPFKKRSNKVFIRSVKPDGRYIILDFIAASLFDHMARLDEEIKCLEFHLMINPPLGWKEKRFRQITHDFQLLREIFQTHYNEQFMVIEDSHMLQTLES